MIVAYSFLTIVFLTLISFSSSNEYQFYESESLKTSNFGEKEFECFGTCYCDENRKISSSFILSKRALSYFFVSASSILAYRRAKSYFDTKCKKELSEECHLSSIKSSVEECSRVVNKEKEKSDKEYFKNREDEERRVYFCYGNCLYNHNLKKESTKKQFSHIKCEKLKQEGEIEVYESDLIRESGGGISTNFIHTADSKFAEHKLVSFCKKNSRKEFIWKGTQRARGKEYPHNKKDVGYGCVSHKKGVSFKNVHCRQIDPEPTNTNWKWRLEKFNREKEDWDLI